MPVDHNNCRYLSTKLISQLSNAYRTNSTEYEVTDKQTTNFWYVPEIWKERQKNRALKHIYDNSNNDPAKKQAWKKQESYLTHLCKKYKAAERKGNLDKVITPKDMAKLTKYAKNGNPKELALIKNSAGATASSPEEALNNLCDAHFQGSTLLNADKIQRSITNANNRTGVVRVIPCNSFLDN